MSDIPDSTQAAVSVERVTHRYPAHRRKSTRQAVPIPTNADRPALDALDLTIEPGEIFGILGPNGGGKSTLFKIIATLLKPTQGSVRVCGYDTLTQPRQVRQQLGVVFQSPSLDLKLTARENLMHHGHMYGLEGAHLKQRQADCLQQVGLIERADDFVQTFSGGMRRRVEIAKAMLHHPKVLLMDEPATGLDPSARRDVWDHLKSLQRDHGVTILLTTHLMDEAERCDRLAIIHKGKRIALETPDNLRNCIGGDVITLQVDQPTQLISQISEKFNLPLNSSQLKLCHDQILIEHADGPAFVAQLGQAFGSQLQRITVGRPTLEDVFVHLTGEILRGEELPDDVLVSSH